MVSAYLTDSITVKSIVYGTWGGTTATETAVKGRFVFETKMTRNLQDEQVVSTANVFLPMMILNHKDKIVFESKEYQILGTERKKDFSNRYLLVNLA